MLKKIFFSIAIAIILIGTCLNVKAINENVTENITEGVIIEKTVTNYVQFTSEEGGEIVLKISNIILNSNSEYKYSLKYNELETNWYPILEKDLVNNTLTITLEKSKTDIKNILKITDIAYLTVQEIDKDANTENIIENQEIDVSLPLSKAYKVGHFDSGFHGIYHTYGVENILYKYVKVQDVKIIRDYLKYLKGYDWDKDEIYWGYYVDNLIDTMDLEKNMPNEGWETLQGNITTTQPDEKGLYFIWIKAPETESNKEILGCVFSNRSINISDIEDQLEEAEKKEELTATVSYNPTTETTGQVIATITANKEVNEVEGWTLLEDKMTLQKSYSENTTELVHLVDIYGETKDVVVEVNNIIKKVEPDQPKDDNTTAPGELPQAGVSPTFILSIVLSIGIFIFICKTTAIMIKMENKNK